MSTRTPTRAALVAALTATLALTGSSLTSASAAATPTDPANRTVTAPNVFYPVPAARTVKDLKTFTSRKATTDIQTSCGTSVRAAHPGYARVIERTVKGRTGSIVRVYTGTDDLWTSYGYLRSVTVQNGDVIQSGQSLGTLTNHVSTRACALAFGVRRGGVAVNPSTWLTRYVGTPPPVPRLFATRGINLVSFNLLGANHTEDSKIYATYPSRMKRAMALLETRRVDVAGLQEYQKPQAQWFDTNGYGTTWEQFYFDPPGPAWDPDNAIIWRRSTMELVDKQTFSVPYFNGNLRAMPAVLLREKATGRTAWYVNTHNPSSSAQRGDNAVHRAAAVAIQRAKVLELRQSGRPVFLMGDFNDNEAAFCPLTAGRLMISPNSQPSDTCAMPAKYRSIDWIFAAGQVRFSRYERDLTPKQALINDHPIIATTAHLQD